MIDFHTHQLKRNAIVNLDPVDLIGTQRRDAVLLKPGYLYSVGIHPWNFRKVTIGAVRLLQSLAAEPAVVAIGECGLDAVDQQAGRDEVLAAQAELLRRHVDLSERLAKPLILHVVKAFPEIIALKRKWRPASPWVIHGFRGKPQLAHELLAHGFYLSYGSKFNPQSFELTPPSRRLRETDTNTADLFPLGV